MSDYDVIQSTLEYKHKGETTGIIEDDTDGGFAKLIVVGGIEEVAGEISLGKRVSGDGAVVNVVDTGNGIVEETVSNHEEESSDGTL